MKEMNTFSRISHLECKSKITIHVWCVWLMGGFYHWTWYLYLRMRAHWEWTITLWETDFTLWSWDILNTTCKESPRERAFSPWLWIFIFLVTQIKSQHLRKSDLILRTWGSRQVEPHSLHLRDSLKSIMRSSRCKMWGRGLPQQKMRAQCKRRLGWVGSQGPTCI